MKKAFLFAVLSLLVSSVVTLAFGAQHTASADRGKALFNDPSLGTSGKTCNDCHPGGRGLEKAGNRRDLDRMVNTCIAGPLKGKPLPDASVEMQSLLLYLKGLGK